MAGVHDDRKSLELQCKSVYVSAEKGGTGYGGNFRRMYGRFLLEAAARTCGPKTSGRRVERVLAVGDTLDRALHHLQGDVGRRRGGGGEVRTRSRTR